MQYIPPATPIKDESLKSVRGRIAEIIIEVRNPCNYLCHYCVATGHNNELVKRFDLAAIEKTLGTIQADLKVIQFDCGGGEPAVHPQFPDLLRICAKAGVVSFPTNNSQDPKRWLPRDVADRLHVRAAIHPEAEENIQKYARHAQIILEAGANFRSLFIAHPDRLHKIQEYRKFFQDAGVPFVPITFIGMHEEKQYPYAYTKEEKELIGLDNAAAEWFIRIQPHANRIRNFISACRS